MEYLEWILETKKDYEFKTLKDFSLDQHSVYIIHFGCPMSAIQVEIDAEIPATCFINLDSKTNDISLCDKLIKTDWEVGYKARMDSTLTLFDGEIMYLSQFFDIKRYWCDQTFRSGLTNSYFEVKDFIRDISKQNNHPTQVLIKGNI